MSELPISSPYRSTPDAPVSDAERDRLNARLNSAYAGGSLEVDDYQRRLDQLFAARRLGDLVPVVEGLPSMPTHQSPAIVAGGVGAPPPGELATARSGTNLTVVAGASVVGAVLLIVVLLVLLL